MILTRQQLLLDLYRAYYDARRHKTKRSYVRQWESGIKDNMERLCRELYDRTYKPQPSKCFIVNYPKKREIFAAMFRDRIVHHLYYNYTSELFGRTFIRDTYSCIKGRGTHDGIARLERFCRKASENWQYKAYALHLDIRGYFIHIDRQRLLEVTLDTLRKMNGRRVSKDGEETWGDVLDMDFVCWMTEQIVTVDPTVDCIVTGDEKDWEGLDPQKSMRNLPPGLGLPIGNLTSQLFSNVFLNRLDQYAKRELGCRYYGRYVDDAIIVSRDKQWLLSLVPVFRAYLRDELGVELHMGKVSVSEVHRGVEFLGAYVKPYRTYVSRRSLERIARNVGQMDRSKPWKMLKSINSYLGMFRHTASYNIRRRMFHKREFLRYGVLDAGLTKMTDRYKFNF